MSPGDSGILKTKARFERMPKEDQHLDNLSGFRFSSFLFPSCLLPSLASPVGVLTMVSSLCLSFTGAMAWAFKPTGNLVMLRLVPTNAAPKWDFPFRVMELGTNNRFGRRATRLAESLRRLSEAMCLASCIQACAKGEGFGKPGAWNPMSYSCRALLGVFLTYLYCINTHMYTFVHMLDERDISM